jgi:tRNA-specific 2-thiouridylase
LNDYNDYNAMRIFVGLSGGVDSAVSTALLKEQGHDVVGVFIKIWQPEFIECTWREDRLDAMRVAAALGIPFREIDLSDEYKHDVVDSMIHDYQAGITPNPDVLCNKSIKFGAFMKWALAQGADFVATGHYAQTKDGKLFRGADSNKDQSYFLYQLTRSDLGKIVFPVGHLTKSEVRKEADRFGLPNAKKHDSQGLCFVGDVSMEDFLRRFISLQKGSVLDPRGKTIGEHSGAALYTIGQRHGFTISNSEVAQTPHYVVSIDTKSNTITISNDKKGAAKSKTAIRDIHWINEPPSLSELLAQVRYRGEIVPTKLDGNICTFESPQIISPGQSIVFYSENQCLGGAIIDVL